MKSLIIFCAFLCVGLGGKKRYDGYQVLEVFPTSPATAQSIRDLEDDVELDVWKHTRVAGESSHIMVPPHRLQNILDWLQDLGLDVSVHIEDVQKLIDNEAAEYEARRKHIGHQAYDWADFNTFEDTLGELDSLAADCPEDFTCQLEDIGSSYDGRPLRKIVITKDGESRRGYWLDATIHAREWLSTTTIMHIAQRLIRNYGEDDDATRLMDTYDWHILPVMNPDGYVQTWEGDRLWRKSMQPNEGSECIGTDLNRNWDYKWGGEGSSSLACSQTYRGSFAADHSETVAQQNEAQRLQGTLDGWVSYHTYGKMFLHSWGHYEEDTQSCFEDPDDHEDLFHVATEAVNAIEREHDTTGWEAGVWCRVLYASTGITIDYVKALTGVFYTFTPELRGNGFIVPPSEIPLAESEMWHGLTAMVEAIEERPHN